MHPQIRQVGPGVCPICGMTLEPVDPTAETGPNPELADMSRRFWIGLVLTVPVVALGMAGGMIHGLPRSLSNWIELVLASPVVLWAGSPFFARGWRSIITRHLNMFTLIAIGTGTAYAYSLAATLAPGIFPAEFRDAGGAVPVYFEAAAAITVLVLLGQVLELRARERTSGAIRALLDLAPRTARRIREDGTDEEVGVDKIIVGDRLRVRPGEKIPVDGEVVDGRAAVDESLVTGESMPVTKAAGDKGRGRSLNGAGSFVMRAEKVGADTLLAQIARRADGERGAAQPRADPAPGRPGVRLVRARRAARRRPGLRRLGRVRARAAVRLRPGGGGVGADHRLPLRPRPGHPDVDHGRRRPRRARGRADQERRGAGALREDRHPGGRQDRHPDRGPPGGHRRDPR